jgi:prepilin-type processing-associated H-X9-DG protein
MIESINHYAGLWLNWQWAMLWQTAVLVGVVAALDRLIRKRAWPQLRYALWLLVLVKLVMPPTLTSPVSVTSTVPTLAQQAMAIPMMTPAPAHRVVREAPAAAEASTSVSEATGEPRPSSPMRQPQPASSSPIVAPVSSLSWSAYAMGAWLVGVVGLSVGLTIHLRRLAIAPGRERPDDVPAWFDAVLEQAAAEMRLRRIPRVVFTTRVCCPAVFGLARPVLLIPADRVSTWTRREAHHVLLHELAHLKRGDLLTHAAYMVLVTLYWFNPLLWLIRKHLQHLRELCCDATVAKCLREETGAYRDTLLDTGRALLARPLDPGLGLLGLFEDPGALVTRLHWLEKPTWRRPWRRRIAVTVVVALMFCCVIPMASLRADAAVNRECKVTFANGAVIELAGLYNEKAGRWWRPDGRPLEEGLLDPDMPHGPPTADCTKIFLRYENLPDGAVGSFGIDPGRGYWGGSFPIFPRLKAKKNGLPVENLTWLEATLEEGADTTSVKAKLAMGHWQDHLTLPFKPRSWSSCSIGEVTFFQPYERDGRTWMPIVHLIQDCDVRIIALDANNVEHASADPGGGKMYIDGSTAVSHRTAEFDLPLDGIDRIRVQRRPYTRIEFKNVSLVPGRSQKIEIVTTEALLLPEPERPVDVAAVREQSPQFLKAFQAGVKQYLKHNGWDWPKQLWSVSFKLDDGRDVHPANFIASVGYFGPNGFQSLRPEYFRAPMASKTPIIYCKRLLEAEEGKGTNVLFGDGHIEPVTARELNRLRETTLP